MELSGTLPENLRAAITSARRLRGSRVHQDTVGFWHELLAFAHTRLGRGAVDEGEITTLIADLSAELAARKVDVG